MNVHYVGKCPHCRQSVVIPYDGGIDEMDTVMVHGAENCLEAQTLLESGKTMAQVAPMFCGHCGGKIPCGCSNPSPQHSNERRV